MRTHDRSQIAIHVLLLQLALPGTMHGQVWFCACLKFDKNVQLRLSQVLNRLLQLHKLLLRRHLVSR